MYASSTFVHLSGPKFQAFELILLRVYVVKNMIG